jgi:hypothetical protein
MYRDIRYIVLLVIIFLTVRPVNAQQRYELPTLFDTNLPRIQLAATQLGIREETNSSIIQEYLKSVNIYTNASWCNAFQYWLMDSVCRGLQIINPMPQSGLANSSYDYALRKGVRTPFIPKPGDLLIWRTEGHWTGHVGMIIQIRNKASVITIEGNTSSNSVRTGGCVEKKVRLTNHPIGKLLIRGIVGFKSQIND